MKRLGTILQATVGLVVLALLLRTFVVIGWMQPIVVSGGSMAPHLVGNHLVAACNGCSMRWGIDPAATEPDPCPQCGGNEVGIVDRGKADRVLVRRLGSPADIRRWDTIVLHSPEDATQLLVKRVLGLPSEQVSFAEGDLWIDGERIIKSLPEQRRAGVLLASSDSSWKIAVARRGNLYVGRERFFRKPITDDLPYNAHVSRKIRAANDRLIRLCVRRAGSGAVEIFPGRPADLRIRLGWGYQGGWHLQACRGDRLMRSITGIDSEDIAITVSTFDRQLLVSLNTTVFVATQLASHANSPPAPPRLIDRSASRIEDLQLYRDVYYEPPPDRDTWRLGPDEYFVVGDNQAISRDSRNWSASAGVPGRLIVGVVPE